MSDPPRQWEGAPASLTLRGVCRACNNGWMSELEVLARPILTPLIFGEPAVMDVEEQVTIAAWGIKASMLWEPASGIKSGFYGDVDRTWLFENAIPPLRTSIWLASYTGMADRMMLGYSTNRSYALSNSVVVPGRLTTMVFGHLVIQTMSIHIEHPGPITLSAQMAPGAWENEGVADVRVWPEAKDGVQWPPSVILTDSGDTAVQDYGRRW